MVTRRSGIVLCFSGANLVPLFGTYDDLRSFAERALRSPRVCSSLVGRAELTLPLWDMLAADWGPRVRCVPSSHCWR